MFGYFLHGRGVRIPALLKIMNVLDSIRLLAL